MLSRALWLTLASALIPSSVSATVTVTPVNAGTAASDAYYYAANWATTTLYGGAFIDPQFSVFDASLTQDTDSGGSQALQFDVTTSKDFTTDSGEFLLLRVLARDSANEYRTIPIAYAGGRICAASDNCQGERSSGRLYGARFTESTTLRIGIYLRDACAGVSTADGKLLTGCNSETTAPDLKAGASGTAVYTDFYLKFSFAVASSSTALDGGDTAEDATSEIRVHLQNYSTVSFTCPSDIKEDYTPGDETLYVNPDHFGVAVSGSGLALPSVLVVTGKKVVSGQASEATVDSDFATANDIVARLPFGQGALGATGFSNTTDGSDNVYNVAFSARDASGIVKKLDAKCGIDGVQTSTISGFLVSSKCFVATAAFGDENAWPVVVLRELRDGILSRFGAGRAFTRWYYAWSPRAALAIESFPGGREMAFGLLVPVVLAAWLLLHPVWLAAGIGALALGFVWRRAGRR